MCDMVKCINVSFCIESVVVWIKEHQDILLFVEFHTTEQVFVVVCLDIEFLISFPAVNIGFLSVGWLQDSNNLGVITKRFGQNGTLPSRLFVFCHIQLNQVLR